MSFDLEGSIAVLSRTPQVLRVLLSDLPVDWLSGNEGRDTWSPIDVLGHLIHGEDTDWIPRARIILTEGEAKPFEPFDRRAQFVRFAGFSLAQLLDLFETRRAENLAILREWTLGERELARKGIHPDFGSVTLRELLATWVTHDLGHIGQIVRVLAKQNAALVGPWKAYLPVLHR